MNRLRTDMAGQRHGKLTVQAFAQNDKHGNAMWSCHCDCGNTATLVGNRIRSGHTTSCGCVKRHKLGDATRKHGKSKTPQYIAFYDAKKRARRKSLPFSIVPEDISIPAICPVLGIPLDGSRRDSLPSLDRIVPELGYVIGNIRVISFRANRIKSDATPDELRLILSYVEGHAR